MSKTTTNPDFLSELKEKVPERKKYMFRPRLDVIDKLEEVSEAEGVSCQKLLEYAIERLHAQWAAQHKKGRKAG